MNLENQSTPTGDSGLGSSAPSTPTGNEGFASSGSPTGNNSGLGETSGNTAGDYGTLEKRFQDTQRAFHQNQAQLSQYQQQIADLQSRVQSVDQLKEALTQSFGGNTSSAEADIFDVLANNPNYIEETVQERLKQALEPFQQDKEQAQLIDYANQQRLAKQEYLENLSSQYGSDFAKEMSDVNDVAATLDPRIAELKAILGNPDKGIEGNPMLTREQKQQLEAELDKREIQAVQSVGGVQNLQKIKLADFVLNNMEPLAQQFYARKQEREQGYRNASGFGPSGSHGAGTINTGTNSGPSNVTTTSIRR